MPRWPSPADLGARLRHQIPALAGAVAVLLVAGLVLSTSLDPSPRTLPPPSSTSSTAAPPTSEPDWSLISLPLIEGATTTTGPRADGFVTFRGTVSGPDGPVPGAVVVAERLVGDAVQRFEATAGGDGVYELGGVPGGRYRVRAYLPPTLAMTEPEIFFQRDFESRQLDLRVEPFTGLVVRATVAPRTPIDGRGVNLAVLVAERRIGDDGVAREVPVAGVPVRVSASGWTSLDGAAARPTDGGGVAVFEFRCNGSGSVSATAHVGAATATPTTTATPDDPAAPPTTAGLSGSFPLEVPGCAPVPTTTTTAPTDDDDGDDGDDDEAPTTTEP